MQIETETHGDLLVIAPKGRVDSNTSPALEAALLERIEAGDTRVSIDFSGVDYISSAGLRVLLMAAKRAGSAKGAFSMHALSPQIREVFEISGFLSILKVHDGLEDVLASR
jgi:anti-anti-sigma factor